MLKRTDLIYPELSYQIIKCAYKVYNTIGPGHLEKTYQRALAAAFREANICFKEQLKHELFFDGKSTGYGVVDFLVEDKIVVEIKRNNFFKPADFEQVSAYLQTHELQLGILIRFSIDRVLYKRVLNQAIERKTA